ncbi:MAG TPA: hypothetical protein VF624_12710 [Tepidisphaeraceae bacterium]|jgi:hypothetical protein
MPPPLLIHLSVFLTAAVLLYAGTGALFRAFGSVNPVRPMWRGAVLAMPVVACGVGLAVGGHGTRGIALAAAAGAVMLTLGTGVVALGAGQGGATSTALRLLAPLAAGITLIGFSGQLTALHGVLVAAMAFTLIWARPADSMRDVSVPNAPLPDRRPLALAALLLALGSAATLLSIMRLGSTVPIAVTTPAIVLMLVVAALGLLATESQTGNGAAGLETVVAYVITALGVALPLAILTAVAQGHLAEWARPPATQPTTAPTTTPTVLLMPVPTWRIDSLVLLVTSLYLIPAGFGRATLGRADGYFLVFVGVAFLVATVATLGRLAG